MLNNIKLSEFIRQFNDIYDSIFNIFPIEYTLVSKQNAIMGKYASRYKKDKQDTEYFLRHRDELGISDDKVKEILSNYPDHSISIAYKILDDRTITMNGENYKELVLTKRHIS